MRLGCEVRNGRYFLFLVEGSGERRPILLPGATPDQETRGYTRRQALAVALIAGFGRGPIDRAIRRAEGRLGSTSTLSTRD
jgi:hypothetical protein